MNLTRALTVFVVFAAATWPCAAVTYSFSGFFGEVPPAGPVDGVATFSLSVADVIRSDSFFPATALTTCTAPVTPCAGLSFFVDAQASGLEPFPGVQALLLTSVGGFGFYYYFPAPAFSTSGSYSELFDVDRARLVVAVPEPGTSVLLLAGIPMLIAARQRRRRRTPSVALGAPS